MDTKSKKTFQFEIDMDYLDGDGRAIAQLLISLGKSLEHLYGQDLRHTDNKGDYFVAELRNEEGRIFGRALATEDDFVAVSCIAGHKPSCVVDASVMVPVASEAAQCEKAVRNNDERTN